MDLLVIGHLVQDLAPEGYRPGGAALYSALTAAKLGWRVALVTSAGPDWRWPPLPPGIEVSCVPSPVTTTFENRYYPSGRQQRVMAVAGPLTHKHIPRSWLSTPTVLLAPVAQEVDPNLAFAFPRALVAAAAQGWLRAWDESGCVHSVPWKGAAEILPHLGAVILSEDDIGGDWRILEDYAGRTRLLAVTQGRKGATIFYGGERRHFPAYPAREVDPTGAGDVFAAAFLVELVRRGDPYAAARFANAAASLAVEHLGVSGIPTEAEIRRRMHLEL